MVVYGIKIIHCQKENSMTVMKKWVFKEILKIPNKLLIED